MTIDRSNWSAVPNVIIDDPGLSPHAFRVAVLIARRTWGWHKETDSISLSQIVEATGMARSTAQKAVTELEAQGCIIVDSAGPLGGRPSRYTLRIAAQGEPGSLPGTGRSLGPSHGPLVSRWWASRGTAADLKTPKGPPQLPRPPRRPLTTSRGSPGTPITVPERLRGVTVWR